MANKFHLNQRKKVYGTGESKSFIQGREYNIGVKVAEAAVSRGYATYEKPVVKQSKEDSKKIAELKKLFEKNSKKSE